MTEQPILSTVTAVTVAPVVTLDGSHLFSNSKRYNQICSYFKTNEFKDVATFEICDNILLHNISEGATNYLRQMGDAWSKSVVVCKNAEVNTTDTGDHRLVLDLDVSSTAATE